ncbi:LuxR family transcriptional regulator [Rhizobiaceae bacterium BDR2-2]|uniref:LuxR family transcriptional regulator n=1 Tax=Ectorhizobium quercum TaxID=2965071 RepID=A0AAE3SX34_9HYPH|nr:LuxR family transcriptional regulator [Ectorhizobium quercum]MCX8996312.1 LuxR family transcriptional regulator [Ectorhizobium quercum]MCX8998649.1 LuxR family transcriptional regulator [Ectorhizobium quercum]
MDFADDNAIAARLEKATTEISGLETQFDVFRFLKRLTEDRRMKAFMVMARPTEFSSELSACTLITNWPTDLLNQYDRKELLPHSPVFRQLRQSTRPFHFDARTAGEHGALFESFGMRHGLWFPVHGSFGALGAIAFSGETPPRPLDLVELCWISIAVYDQLQKIERRDTPARELLTEREVACLVWTSAGKTSAEIAEILGLSEHTVNHYLNRATRKLDAVNRAQAVAKAMRLNILK